MQELGNDVAKLDGSALHRRPPGRFKRISIPLTWPAARHNHQMLRWCWFFVALGLLVRIVRYLLRFPLWGDECSLAANLLDRSFVELLKPLDYQQVAPPLFLWIELAAVRVFGFNEWSLRAFPLVCSLASVVLFRHLAARMFRGVPLLLAVAILSVSYYPLRHSSEVKPYASDLLVAVILLWLAVSWNRRPLETRWLWALAAAVPFSLAVSHPATFVAGGVLAVVSVRMRWVHQAWPALVVCAVSLLCSFGLIYFVSTAAQMDAASAEGIMETYWARSFPPTSSVLASLQWFIAVHAGQMFAYPFGGASNGSGVLAWLCFAVGLLFLIRRGRVGELGLFLSPFALTLIAAALHAYPYGGAARTSQHVAPIICLVAGLGASRLVSLWPRSNIQRAAIVSSAGLLALLGTGLMVLDLVHPFRSEHDRRVREFARWFWTDKAIDAELVCACTDLKLDIFRHTYLWRGIAQYLCNQRIYSPRHQQGGTELELDSVLPDRPLRCVVFSRPGLSRDEVSFARWLDGMRQRFDLVGYERNDFHKPHEHGPDIERIEVYEFVPREIAVEGEDRPGLVRPGRDLEPNAN